MAWKTKIQMNGTREHLFSQSSEGTTKRAYEKAIVTYAYTCHGMVRKDYLTFSSTLG